MSDTPDELVRELLGTEGVEEVSVHTTVTVTHRKDITGEVDDAFNDVRERVVPEEELERIAGEHGAEYHGTVDVPNEFKSVDRMSIQRNHGGGR